jgi:transposase
MGRKPNQVPCSPGWIGIDVSKDFFDVAIWGGQAFPAMLTGRFPRSPAGAGEVVSWIELQHRAVAGVVMEWTGHYSRDLAEWLMELRPDWPIAMVNPSLVKAFAKSYGLRNKTDQVDARVLAQYGVERTPAAWRQPEPDQDAIQSIYRTRLKLTLMSTALRNRSQDCPNAADVAREAQEQVLAVMGSQIKALEEAATKIIAGHGSWAHDRKLLMSVPGVGPISSLGVLAEAGDLRRFRRGRQLAAFLGTSPKRKQSGTSVNGKTRMCRVGGKFVRPALYMAAMSLTDNQGPLGDFYRHLVAQGKPERAAMGALMRKLLLIMRSVLIQNAPYQPRPIPGNTEQRSSTMARPA